MQAKPDLKGIEIELDGVAIRARRSADATMIAAIVHALKIGPFGTIRVMVTTKPIDFRNEVSPACDFDARAHEG